MTEAKKDTATKATRKRSASKPAAKSETSHSNSGGSNKVNEILSAIVDHVTRHGSEADDAFAANVHELSGGKVGRAAKGSTDENSPVNQ